MTWGIWLTVPRLWLYADNGIIQFPTEAAAYLWVQENLTGLEDVYYRIAPHTS